MSNDRPKRETRSTEEAIISSKWEIAAIVEVLVRTGGIIEMGQRVVMGATHLQGVFYGVNANKLDTWC